MTEQGQAMGGVGVSSPCVRNCCLDDQDICLGCYRSIAEIIHWNAAGPMERSEILLRCAARREQRHNARVDETKQAW